MAAPSRKPSTKGAPPKPTDTTHVVGNNTQKPEAGEEVPCNFRVDPEFKRRFKTFCVTHDREMKKVFVEAMEEYMAKRGG